MRELEKAFVADPRKRADVVDELKEFHKLIQKRVARRILAKTIKGAPAHEQTLPDTLAEAALLEMSAEFSEEMNRQGDLQEAVNILVRVLNAAGRESEAKVLSRGNPNRGEFHWACAYQALGISYSSSAQAGGELLPNSEQAGLGEGEQPASLSAALRHYYARRIGQALETIDRASAIQRAPELLVFKGFLMMARKDYELANRLFVEAAERPDGEFGAAIGRGHLALVSQEYGRAQALFEPALDALLGAEASRPPVGEYHDFLRRMGGLGMGWLHANQGQHEPALGYFDRVLVDRPSDLLAHLGRCNSLIGLFRMDQAEAALLEVLDLDPENPDAQAQLASIRLSRGQLSEAEAGFKRALATRGAGYTCPYEGLGLVYLKRGQVEAAKEQFEKAISINPDIEYKKFNGLARIYITEGRTEEAKKLLLKSIVNYPYDDEAREMLEELER